MVGNQTLDATVDLRAIRNFTQEMNFYHGVVSWGYIWSPKYMNVELDLSWVTLVSREKPNVAATSLEVTPRGRDINVTIIDLLDGRSAVRSFLGKKGISNDTNSIFVSNHPVGLPNVTVWTVSTANVSNGYTDESSRRSIFLNNSTIKVGQKWNARLINNQPAVFHKFIGIASSDYFPNPKLVATQASRNASEDRWNSIYTGHTKA